LGPRVWGALKGMARPRLRAWGPWWVPLWERTLRPGKSPAAPCRLKAPAPSDSLHWLTLEAGGKILCGVQVLGGEGSFPIRVEVREVRVPYESVALAGRGERPSLEPLSRPRAGRTPLGFPGGGLGMDLSAHTAFWVFFSPDLDLRSFWLVPRLGPGGKYAFLQVECRTDPSDWGRPGQEWGLDGEKVRRIRGPFPPGIRIFSAGFRFLPWKGPFRVPTVLEREAYAGGLSFWSPGWDSRPGRKDVLLVGHSDWRRFLLLLPRREGWGLLPLWPAEPYKGVSEDRPEAIWRISWERKGARRASFRALGIPPGEPFAGGGKGWNWAVLVIHEEGGIGRGFTSGGIPLRAGGGKGPSRPFVLLETPMFSGGKSKGLIFWDPAVECRLEWGKGLFKTLHHRATLEIRPGPTGLTVEETLK